MCGGIGFSYSAVKEDELRRFYTDEEVERFRASGEVQSFYWQKHPVLPVETEAGVNLFNWGNRDKAYKLPATGWARLETLDVKWRYLHPRRVIIPARRGYEKKVWFDLAGILGISIDVEGDELVYMVTEPADKEYQELTKHNRMPVGISDK